MSILTILHSLSTRLKAYRRRQRHSGYQRPTPGLREMMDLGIYRGHLDRVASAENEAI